MLRKTNNNNNNEDNSNQSWRRILVPGVAGVVVTFVGTRIALTSLKAFPAALAIAAANPLVIPIGIAAIAATAGTVAAANPQSLRRFAASKRGYYGLILIGVSIPIALLVKDREEQCKRVSIFENDKALNIIKSELRKTDISHDVINAANLRESPIKSNLSRSLLMYTLGLENEVRLQLRDSYSNTTIREVTIKMKRDYPLTKYKIKYIELETDLGLKTVIGGGDSS